MKTAIPVEKALSSLLAYCRQENWSGYDPYDGLNSKLFQATPLKYSKLARLVMIQGFKRLPLNLRPLFLIEKTQNPKALALFLSTLIMLKRGGYEIEGQALAFFIERIRKLRAKDCSYWAWGYSFPWQTRTVLVPRFYPNLVCTVFVADALMDAYDYLEESSLLEMAISAARYIVDVLYWCRGDEASFSYPLPNLKENVVHNANFLASSFLSRIFVATGDKSLLEPALKAARFSAARQESNGAWYYGERGTQRWVDNFHTGYNLCALKRLGRYLDTEEFLPVIKKGFRFYKDNFFEDQSVAKYFHNKKYPIDVHAIAQSILTLIDFQEFEDNKRLIENVYSWAVCNMRSPKGYFYYQLTPFYTNRISYMRWSQAWMLQALSRLWLFEQGKC